MQLMTRYPDNYFDLAIVDPPYGINYAKKAGEKSGQKYGNASAKKRNYIKKDWDLNIPNQLYFDELKRVSKNQIVWGGNYMTNYLEQKSGWIFWDKNNGENDFSDGELAWSSFDCGLRKIEVTWSGMIQYDMKNKEDRFHPTQKPIKLYKWLLHKYAKPGDKILDTHLGSGSIAIACHDYGFDLTACELDKEYFDKAMQRITNHTNQLNLFI
jgi:site-specific DNA-methyltransferase (adenine-specific)